MILVFDTETSGLPLDFRAPVSDTANWPHVVQLAWAIFDAEGQEVKRYCSLIQPNGFTIDSTAAAIHGITKERAVRDGDELYTVLSHFLRDIEEHDPILVAHNYLFDRNVLGASFLRIGLMDPFVGRQWVCTMQSAASFFTTPGGKWPKLEELYEGLIGSEMVGAHDALYDVLATAECFFELKRRGLKTAPMAPSPTELPSARKQRVVQTAVTPPPFRIPALEPVWHDAPLPPLDVLFSSYEYNWIEDYDGPVPAILYGSYYNIPLGNSDPDFDRLIGEVTNLWRGEPRPMTSHVRRLLSLAAECSDQGNYEGAIEHLLTAYELDGHHTTTLFRLGYAHYEIGAFEEAVRWFRALLKKGENRSTTICLAVALAKVGDTEGAAELAHQSALVTDDLEHHRLAGELYLTLLHFVWTVAEVLDRNEIDSDTPEAQALRKYAELAAYHYERALESATCTRDRTQLAKALYKLGRVDCALDLLEESRSEEPDVLAHACIHGDVLWAEERWNAAADAYTAALSLQPDHAYASFARGRCYGKLDRWPQAFDDFEHAVSHAQDKPTYRRAYSRYRNEAKTKVDDQKRKEKERIEAEEHRWEEIINSPVDSPTSYVATRKRKPVFWKTVHFVAIPFLLFYVLIGTVGSVADFGRVLLLSYLVGVAVGWYRWWG